MARLLALLLLPLLGLSALSQPIQRSQAEVRAFRQANPCPSTGKRSGACPGYQVDHSRALCMGGLDSRENMAWLATDDHKWKTLVDVRECRKLKKMAGTPARDQSPK